MLINNGALLICSRRKRRRKMPHTSLTYFYWHARLHGRHGKVFSEKTGTLPLFAFVSSSHWAAIPSHMSECRLDRWYMLILLCEGMQNCFVSMRIVMLPNICYFHASNITCMLRWCSDIMCGMAHIMEWFFCRYSFWHLSMSQEFTYKDTSITSQLLFECPPMNYSMYIFQRSILATLECHQSGQCCRARNSFETTCF